MKSFLDYFDKLSKVKTKIITNVKMVVNSRDSKMDIIKYS